MSRTIDDFLESRPPRLPIAWWLSLAVATLLAACGGDAPPAPGAARPVASVHVPPLDTPLTIGQRRRLVATPRAEDGAPLPDRPVQWASDAPQVATIAADGTLHALSAGRTVVRATSEGRAGSIDVEVREPTVPTLTALTPDSATAGSPGLTLRAVGSGFPADAVVELDGVALTTRRLDASALEATVTATLLITPRVAIVRVRSGGDTRTAPLPFTVLRASHTIPAPTLTQLVPNEVLAGRTTPLTITLRGSGFGTHTRVWLDDALQAATRIDDSTMTLRLEPASMAAARALAVAVENPGPPGGGRATATFTVRSMLAARVELTAPWGALWSWRDDRLPLQATVRDAQDRILDDRPLTWSLSDSALADVFAAGPRTAAVYGRRSGTVRVKASADGASMERTVRIFDAPRADLVYEFGTGDDRHLAIWSPGRGNAPEPVRVPQVAFEPSPSPDGARIAFAGTARGGGVNANIDIWVTSRDGAQLQRLTTDDAYDGEPTWSPDGQRIAFSSARSNGLRDIWVMQHDGSNPVRLTDARFDVEPAGSGFGANAPAWSPDGRRIAYTVMRTDGNGSVSTVWIMNADGTGKRALTSGREANDFSPSWSPDGRLVVMHRRWKVGGQVQIALFDAETGAASFLISNEASVYAASPAFSPDGAWITATDIFGGDRPALYAMPVGMAVGARIVIPSELHGARRARWMTRP